MRAFGFRDCEFRKPGLAFSGKAPLNAKDFDTRSILAPSLVSKKRQATKKQLILRLAGAYHLLFSISSQAVFTVFNESEMG